MSTFSSESLKSVAKEASSKYLANQTPMNETIQKEAQRRDLNDHQVERVAQMANHMVNAKLAEDSAYTDFELADAGKIREAKTASWAGAYLGGASGEDGSMSKTAETEELSAQVDAAMRESGLADIIDSVNSQKQAPASGGMAPPSVSSDYDALDVMEAQAEMERQLGVQGELPSDLLADAGTVEEKKKQIVNHLGGQSKEKTASRAPSGDGRVELIEKVAAHYGVDADLGRMDTSSRPVFHFMKTASDVIRRAAERMEAAKHAMMEAEEEVFEEVRQALLDGVPMSQIAKDMKASGALRALKNVWPRLEAEGLVPPSHYEEGGPHSEHRRLKKAERIAKEAETFQEMGLSFELEKDAPLLKAARAIDRAAEDMEMAGRAAKLLVDGAEKVAEMEVSNSELQRTLAKAAQIEENIEKMASGLGIMAAMGAAKDKAKKSLATSAKNVAGDMKDFATGAKNFAKKTKDRGVGGNLWAGTKSLAKNTAKGVYAGTKKSLKGAYKGSKSLGKKIVGKKRPGEGKGEYASRVADRVFTSGGVAAGIGSGVNNAKKMMGKKTKPGY